MRTTTDAMGPRFPSASRTCAAIAVSPSGKALAPVTCRQNWVTGAASEANEGAPNASTVQARCEFVNTTKPHAKSLRPSATCWEPPKSNGLNPRTPFSVQTSGSPSPNEREAWTCKSGRALGSVREELSTAVPTWMLFSPGAASTTSWNPEPTGR